MTPEQVNFLEVVKHFLGLNGSSDNDHEIEMRWFSEYDGSTEWHTLFDEPTMARYGLFPHQAEYRIKIRR